MLLLFFLIIRIPILFSSVSNLILDQELCVGTFTKILTQDSKLPIFACLDRHRWGGVATGILAVPFFLLLGDTLVALRSVIMIISLCTLIVLYLFLYEFFNKRTAIVASLIFILSPPNYTRISYISSGSYSELNFFTFLTIFVFFKIFFVRKSYAAGYLYALLGFLCGFGFLYDYPFLLTIVCCLFFWFIFDTRFFLRRHFYISLIFFLIGFSPWFLYNIFYKWEGVFVIHGRSIWRLFTSNSLSKSMTQFKDLLLFDIPGYFDFKDLLFIKGTYISYAYYFVFAASFLYLAWVHRRSLLRLIFGLVPLSRFRISSGDLPGDIFLIVYSAVFCLVYSLCGFPIFPPFPIRENIIFPYKEIFPLTLFIFIIVARSLDIIKKSAHKYGPFIFYACLSIIIIITAVANIRLIDLSSFTVSLIPKGYNYVRL